MNTFDERDVASYLDLDPRNPIDWPVPLLRSLLALLEDVGHEEFQYEVWRVLRKYDVARRGQRA